MRILSLSFALLTLAFGAGCAQQSRTSEMGAGPAGSATATKLYCRDGAWENRPGGCAMHGGVERDMTPATQK